MKHLVVVPMCLVLFSGWGEAGEVSPEAAAQLEKQWAPIENPAPTLSSRALFTFALEASALGWRPDRVEAALERAEQMQDRDEKSSTYGNFRWSWRDEKPMDRNAVEFSMQHGILLWMLHRDRLTAPAKERLERLIRFSVEGIRRHQVAESYTNIFLMKIWNCVAIGENTGRPDLTDEGLQMLERWLIYTADCGIHEYLSPTYYGVDLDSLALLAKFAKRSETRQTVEAILRLFWTDIAANWFAPCQRLGGAHSRDYDYLTGHGPLDRQLEDAGWIPASKPVTLRAARDLCAWTPLVELRESLAAQLPRTVHQRWGGAPGENATQYVGRRFSIGSAGACYGTMDKPLTVNLAGGPAMPMLNVLMDARGDPYGKQKDLVGGGHYKALHVQPFLMSVQRGAEALLLASIDPASKGFGRDLAEPSCLLTHVVMPAEVRIVADEFPGGKTVFLRFGDVAVGVRIVLALDGSGRPAPVELVNDGAKEHHAMRLTCVHAKGKPQGRATAAVWVRAAEGLDDAAFAHFRSEFAEAAVESKAEGDIVEVAAAGLSGELRLRADVGKGQRLVCQGGDPGAEGRLLEVNGKDYGREILGGFEPVRRYWAMLAGAKAGEAGAPTTEETIQAEDALLLVPPFRIGEAAEALGGKFVWMPGEPGGKGSSSVARAVWAIHVPRAGSYSLWARVQAPTPSDDSFYVRIRQGDEDSLPKTDWPTGVREKWEWIPFRLDPKSAEAARIQLKGGAAVVELFCREDGTKIDALRLTAQK